MGRGGRSAQVAVKLARWPPLASVGRRLPLIGGLERLYPDGDRSGGVCERTLLQLGLLFAVVHPEPAGRLVLARSSGAAGATDAQAKEMPPRRRGDCPMARARAEAAGKSRLRANFGVAERTVRRWLAGERAWTAAYPGRRWSGSRSTPRAHEAAGYTEHGEPEARERGELAALERKDWLYPNAETGCAQHCELAT
jgi:hypothetical protein